MNSHFHFYFKIKKSSETTLSMAINDYLGTWKIEGLGRAELNEVKNKAIGLNLLLVC